jgi:hypothetical protein
VTPSERHKALYSHSSDVIKTSQGIIQPFQWRHQEVRRHYTAIQVTPSERHKALYSHSSDAIKTPQGITQPSQWRHQNVTRHYTAIPVTSPRKITQIPNKKSQHCGDSKGKYLKRSKFYCRLNPFLHATYKHETKHTAASNRRWNYSHQTPLGTRLGSRIVSELFCLVETSAVWESNYRFLDTKGNWKLRSFFPTLPLRYKKSKDNDKLNFFFFI